MYEKIVSSKYFCIEEFVSVATYKEILNEFHAYGRDKIAAENHLWTLIHPLIISTADWVKEFVDMKPVTINDWKWGGNYNQSGLRDRGSKYFSETSQHSIGCAIDVKIKGMTSEEFRNKLKQIPKQDQEALPFTRVEEGTDGWVHLDIKYSEEEGLYFFNP